MSDEKPPAVWLYHPPSGQFQQVSRKAYDDHIAITQADPNIEGPLHRWVPCLPDQIPMAEQTKAEKLGLPWPPPPPDDEQEGDQEGDDDGFTPPPARARGGRSG